MSAEAILRCLLAGLLLVACSGPEKSAGKPGVDETSNGIAAQIYVQDGSVARNARILRVSCDFNATIDTTLFSDSLGKVFLDTTEWGGRLCLEIRGDSVAARVSYALGDSTQLDSIVLERWVRVHGKVELPPSQAQAWIGMFGIHGRVKTRFGGEFTWDSLPPGEARMQVMLLDTPMVISTVETQLAPGSETELFFEEVAQNPNAWTKSAQIFLNTKGSGSNLKENLYHFPVLLWLDSNSFPVEAASGGADLRMEKESGEALSFEIESWDSQAQIAKIWVLLDTLKKNDSLQSIRLRWGNKNAIAANSSQQVFDTANGWMGVWHLSGAYQDSLNRYRVHDATSWKNDGLVHGYLNWLESPFGRVVRFDGVPNTIAFSGSPMDFGRSSFTWELWVQTSQIGAEIFHVGTIDTLWERGEKQIFLGIPNKPYTGSLGWNPTFLGRRTSEDNVYASCSLQMVAEEWTHLVLRRTISAGDSGRTDWFVNGAMVGESSFMELLEPDNAADSMYLGVDLPDNPRMLQGAMAEFRISNIPRSAEWIRMDHFQQENANRGWIRIQP